MKHSECNREIREPQNTKEKLREMNNRIRMSINIIEFHRKMKRNGNETIFEMIIAKNCQN